MEAKQFTFYLGAVRAGVALPLPQISASISGRYANEPRFQWRVPLKGLCALFAVVVCSACSTVTVQQADTPSEVAATAAKPVQQQVPGPQPLQPVAAFGKTVTTVKVNSRKRLTNAVYRRIGPDLQFTIPPSENINPGRSKTRGRGKPVEIQIEKALEEPSIEAWVDNSNAFLSTNFATNPSFNGGFVFIPPDSHAAAGPLHVVNVVNTVISFHQKDGTLDHRNSLSGFFSGLSPATKTFDPKVVYDQYRKRWLVVTLEQTEGPPPANDTSKIFLAVSDDANPIGAWTVTSFDSKITIGGSTRWADYPGFAVGQDAVYIAVNMFGFSSGIFGGTRLWIVDKGVGSGGFYDGGTAVFSVEDPYAGAGLALTTQPAHMYGAIPGSADTYLVGYSGLTVGGNDSIQIVRVDDPLGTPIFTHAYEAIGDIDDTSSGLPDAAQLGSATAIEVNDRRALDAVWIDDTIWMTATVLPPTGVNAGQATAYWFEVDTTTPSSLIVADQGMIGGEGIATGASTFFPAVAVNGYGDVTIGFSASDDSIYAGSYFVTRETGDAAGTTGPAQTVVAGTDFYVRTFGGSRNRWGDYSATAVDPVDGCFWVYNQHAQSRGTVISMEDGRWATAYARSCNLTHACSDSVSIPANEWTNFAMPCNTSPNNEVSDVFSGLTAGDYGNTWIVYRRISSTPASYVALTITDTLVEGAAYWVFSNNATTVSLTGTINTLADIDLFGVGLGRQNYVGHNQDAQISWADVLFIDGGDVLTLTEADTAGSISRTINKWNGSAYQTFNGISPQTGTLDAFDGFWVKVFDSGIKLRIPQSSAVSVDSAAPASAEIVPMNLQIESSLAPGKDLVQKKDPKKRPWHIQLTVTSGNMQDPGNFFGRIEGSSKRKDLNDLEELAPFGSRYLTVLFTNPKLQGVSWGYTSDFRQVKKKPGGTWSFVVKASSHVSEATLNWEGHDFVFENAWLTDEESGETLKVHSFESYTFDMIGGEHHFTFEIVD